MTVENLGKTLGTIIISHVAAQDFADEVITIIEESRSLRTVSSHVCWLTNATRLARQLENKITKEGTIDYDGAFNWVIREWHPETCNSIFNDRLLELTAESALRVLLGDIEDVSDNLSKLIGCDVYNCGDDDDDDPTEDVWGGTMGVEG